MPCKVLWLAPFARKHARRGSMSSDNRYEILYRSLNIIICHFMHFLIAKNIHTLYKLVVVIRFSSSLYGVAVKFLSAEKNLIKKGGSQNDTRKSKSPKHNKRVKEQ
jgi:hypothetical protein